MTRTVPLLDLRAQFATIRSEILPVLERVVESQQFILGDEVKQFETEVAAYCGTEFAIGCASGSDALRLALMALDIGPGDKVLTTPYTFFATASAIALQGAMPVFADVDPSTFNLDTAQAARAVEADSRIKAILPVHLFGGCAEMETIRSIARNRGIAVIEDSAQSIGSEFLGRRAGSMGNIGCFSFFPSKNLGAFGDAGLCTTNDPDLAYKFRSPDLAR